MRLIAECNMLDRLVVLLKFNLVSTIVEWKSLRYGNFLYRHFKRIGHTPTKVSVQPVEIETYDLNSTPRFKIIKTELKWIKLLQTSLPLGFNDNIYHENNISKMPEFDVFSLLECCTRKTRSQGIRKNGNYKRKNRANKRASATLKCLSKVLKDHGRHSMLSFISSLSISVFRSLDTLR